MRGLLAAVAVTVGGAWGTASEAATMTFDGIPEDPIATWEEDGIRATGGVGYAKPGTAHLDDAGTPYARSLTFTMASAFDAVSFEIYPSSSAYVICDPEDIVCVKTPVENVRVTGFRAGGLVAEKTLDMFLAGPLVELGGAFTGLDSLVIGFAALYEGYLPDGSYAYCSDFAPCTHYNIDDVTLAPIPLPASGALLLGALSAIAGLRARRKLMSA